MSYSQIGQAELYNSLSQQFSAVRRPSSDAHNYQLVLDVRGGAVNYLTRWWEGHLRFRFTKSVTQRSVFSFRAQTG